MFWPVALTGPRSSLINKMLILPPPALFDGTCAATSFLHRAGRCGRFGRTGLVLSLVLDLRTVSGKMGEVHDAQGIYATCCRQPSVCRIFSCINAKLLQLAPVCMIDRREERAHSCTIEPKSNVCG
ncbi:TPA: hypothetical protein ACH3X2_003433 [Trebouxia sp. C0005]